MNCRVAFLDDAAVEDDDHTGVVLAADQTAEALFKFDDGHRELIVHKGVWPFGAFARCGPDERVAGHGKRQTHDDTLDSALAGDIDALPEAVSAEQNATIAFFKQPQHLVAIQPVALREQFHLIFVHPVAKLLGHAVEHCVAGKEHKRPPGAFEQIFFDRFAGAFDKIRCVRVGHIGFNVEFDLSGVVEGRADLQRFKCIQPDALGKERKARFVGGAATEVALVRMTDLWASKSLSRR